MQVTPRIPSDRSGAAAWLPFLVVLLLAGLVAWGWMRGQQSEEAPMTLEERYLADPRIGKLVADCSVGLPYDQDTSDLMDVLVGKLARGHIEVLHRFKEVLAQEEAAAIPALQRLFEESYSGRFDSPILQNVLAACSMMRTPAGLDLARSGFQHPREDVRLAALDVLKLYAEPEDYDEIAGWLPMVATQPTVLDYLKALRQADPDRFADESVGWMETGQFVGMEYLLAPLLSGVQDPQVAERMKLLVLQEKAPQPARAALLVPAARAGDEEAIGLLTQRLQSEVDQRVNLALQALSEAGLHDMAQAVLGGDARPGLRERAATILAEAEPNEENFVWLNEGLSDSESIVRQACLRGLLARKDPAAVSRVLLNLTKSSQERDAAMGVLATHWDADPDLPQKVFDYFAGEYRAQSTQAGRVGLLKSIARIPLAEATRFLFEHLDDLPEEVSGLPAHRWLAGHAFNGGPAAMTVLYERLRDEQDPIYRLDLIGMIWQDKSETSEQILLDVLQNPEQHPFERLWAADCLTRIAHPSTLAPLAKQFYLESTHRYVRPALQCLLWRWYGLPNA